MNEVAIRVENLSKRYRIGLEEEMHDTLASAVGDFLKRPVKNLRRLRRLTRFSENGHEPGQEAEDVIWALKDVSFEVKRGDVVGIIGRNGAGKSTLLKILSRITHPTSGRYQLRGRVSSLLEVGTGFHPELTGRENIYLNGTILGMRKVEIDHKFDEIVDFSGVEKFIDTPVKRYSSGMRVRLAFSVAAHLEPEILLVDEVLAVGDVGFRKKSLGKMGSVAREGRTVLLVSHSMAAIENLCDTVIFLEEGQISAKGAVDSVIPKYLSLFESTATGERNLVDPELEREGTGEVQFHSVRIHSSTGKPTNTIRVGDGITIHMKIASYAPVENVEVGVALFNSKGLRLCGFNSHDLGELTFTFDKGQTSVLECRIPRLNIAPDTYTLNLLIRKRNDLVVDRLERAVAFEIIPADVFGTGRVPQGKNLIYLDVDWWYEPKDVGA